MSLSIEAEFAAAGNGWGGAPRAARLAKDQPAGKRHRSLDRDVSSGSRRGRARTAPIRAEMAPQWLEKVESAPGKSTASTTLDPRDLAPGAPQRWQEDLRFLARVCLHRRREPPENGAAMP